MKHLIPIFIFFSSGLPAQNLKVPIYYDKGIVSKTADSLLKSNVDEIIILLTDKYFPFDRNEDSIKTFICWRQHKSYFIKLVTANKNYIPFEFAGLNAFSFPQKAETFITSDEKTLKFTPPLTNDNAVFYLTNNEEKYFEQPDNLNQIPATYFPTKKEKEQLRQKWFRQIVETVRKINFENRVYDNYDRHKEMLE